MSTTPPLCTRVGVSTGPDNRYFGLSVNDDLQSGESLAGLIGLSVLGRRITPAESAVLDDIGVAIVAADPRIWPLKLARIASAYGRAIPAIAATVLVFDSEWMGPASAGTAARHLMAIDATLCGVAQGDVDSAVAAFLSRHDRIAGFGVPFRPYDERLAVLRALLARRGRSGGRFWHLSESVTRSVQRRKRLMPNLSLGVAAALLDLGMSAEQIDVAGLLLQSPVVAAHALEGAQQAPAVLRRLPDACVRFVGARPRVSPLGVAAREAPSGDREGE